MIDRTAVIPTVKNKLKKLPPNHYLKLLTYKKDRSITVVKLDDDNLMVMEEGFTRQRHHAAVSTVHKLLKTLLKREFPRSNKVRLSSGEYQPDECRSSDHGQ